MRNPRVPEHGSAESDDPITSTRPSINPYVEAVSLVWHRVAWDLRIESWRSRRRLRAWRDRYAGGKAVIVCNGPSLLKSDLSLLEGVFTFGLNKINILFDRSSFRPSCIVAVNPLVIEQNARFYNETQLPLFLDSAATRFVQVRGNLVFLHSASSRHFARDCSVSVYQGHTVTYVALQLAFHMGFTQVALIGADHDFAEQGPANKTVVSSATDASHFDPQYFAGGVKWQLPDLPQSEIAYKMAKQVYEAFGRRIVNASEGGKLEIFERLALADFVNR